ncbi:MAG TPA: DUF1844 domain-containing protein [Methylomirabilota bacterium]|nr:DUF1844 domain-containing protein [Methylomirabilota bacterium]
MNGKLPEDNLRQATREEIISAIFANMVIEHSQTALMLMGRMPNPQGGPPIKDLENAKRFIDEIEMLAEKTKGNLNAQEQQLMRQSLGTLRAVFVQELEAQMSEEGEEAGGQEFRFSPEAAPSMGGSNFGGGGLNFTPAQPPAQPAPAPEPVRPAAAAPSPEQRPAAAPQPAAAPAATAPASAPEVPEESRKKFVKKY